MYTHHSYEFIEVNVPGYWKIRVLAMDCHEQTSILVFPDLSEVMRADGHLIDHHSQGVIVRCGVVSVTFCHL